MHRVMQRCRFCSRVLNPKAFSCTYCGKKTERQAPSLLKTSAVALPPLEYAGGVVAAAAGGHATASSSHQAPEVRATPAHQPIAPGELDLAAFDAALAAAAQQATRRRWFRRP